METDKGLNERIDIIAKNQGYRLARFDKLQKRPSFIAKAFGYTDRLATYIKETESQKLVMIAFRSKPSAKALEYIRNNTTIGFDKETVITGYFNGQVYVLRKTSIAAWLKQA